MTDQVQAPAVAIIGGTGLDSWPGFDVLRAVPAATPYGETSSPLLYGRIAGVPVVFLPRHGKGHSIPPHRINARANLWALRDAGIRRVIAIGAVGGIADWMGPAEVAVAHDLIDYTWGREHSYFDGQLESLTQSHVDMSQPYSPLLRAMLLDAATRAGVACHDGGVIGVTQGPRLETPAEVRRLQRDGCDMISMTALPEAALAREIELHYATLAVSVNWAAGLSNESIHETLAQTIRAGMTKVELIINTALPLLAD